MCIVFYFIHFFFKLKHFSLHGFVSFILLFYALLILRSNNVFLLFMHVYAQRFCNGLSSVGKIGSYYIGSKPPTVLQLPCKGWQL